MTAMADPLKRKRRIRAINIASSMINAAVFGFDLSDGHSALAAMPAFMTVVLVVLICLQTRDIHRREAMARRPDYDVIARMEREIFGDG